MQPASPPIQEAVATTGFLAALTSSFRMRPGCLPIRPRGHRNAAIPVSGNPYSANCIPDSDLCNVTLVTKLCTLPEDGNSLVSGGFEDPAAVLASLVAQRFRGQNSSSGPGRIHGGDKRNPHGNKSDQHSVK